jgi:hypothetical protein
MSREHRNSYSIILQMYLLGFHWVADGGVRLTCKTRERESDLRQGETNSELTSVNFGQTTGRVSGAGVSASGAHEL